MASMCHTRALRLKTGPRIRDVGQPNILVPLETRTIKNVRNQPRNTDIIFFCKPEGFFMLMLQHTDQAAQ